MSKSIILSAIVAISFFTANDVKANTLTDAVVMHGSARALTEYVSTETGGYHTNTPDGRVDYSLAVHMDGVKYVVIVRRGRTGDEQDSFSVREFGKNRIIMVGSPADEDTTFTEGLAAAIILEAQTQD